MVQTATTITGGNGFGTHWMLTQRKSECSGPSMFAWSNVQWLGKLLRELGLTDKWGICGRGRAPVLQVNPPSPPPTSCVRSTLVLYYAIKLTKRLGNISTNITKFHKLTWSFLSVDQYFALFFRRNLQKKYFKSHRNNSGKSKKNTSRWLFLPA